MKRIKINESSEALFNAIYEAAKKQDTKTIDSILRQGHSLDVRYKDEYPIYRLAKRKKYKAVDFLLNKYGCSIDKAVSGFADANDVPQVKKLLKQGASINEAVVGFAKCGNTKLVNKLIEKGACRMHASFGYALRGDEDATLELINQEVHDPTSSLHNSLQEVEEYAKNFLGMGKYTRNLEASVDLNNINDIVSAMKCYAISGEEKKIDALEFPGKDMYENVIDEYYAAGGHYRLLNLFRVRDIIDICTYQMLAEEGHYQVLFQELQTLSTYRTLVINQVATSFASYLHPNEAFDLIKLGADLKKTLNSFPIILNEHRVLRELTFTKDDKFRKKLAEHFAKTNQVPNLYEHATQLRKMMHSHDIDYEEAKALSKKGVRAWLLQGVKLTMMGPKIPFDLFLKMGNELTGLSDNKVQHLFKAVTKKLHDDVARQLKRKYQISWHSYSKNNFFSKSDYKESRNENNEKYKSRLTFIT